MFDTLVSATVTAIDSLRGSAPIMRIDDGRTVEPRVARKVSHLPDRLLHDIGFDRAR